jgi:GNAT superfamily N-acetyltransferase
MRVRQATNYDLPRIVDISIAGNKTDALSRYFQRDTDKYQASSRIGCYRWIRGEFLKPGCLTFVAETEASDYANHSEFANPMVVGFAMWTRNGDSDVAKSWQRRLNSGWLASLNRSLAWVESQQLKVFKSVNPTYDHQRFNELLVNVMSEPWDKELLKEFWELNALFVDPPWQKRGLSRKLIAWGKERATEEGVPVVVHGSPVGGIAYRSNGFHSVGATEFGNYFDELEFGGEVMQNWVWVPEGKGLDEVPIKVREKREQMLRENREKREAKQK